MVFLKMSTKRISTEHKKNTKNIQTTNMTGIPDILCPSTDVSTSPPVLSKIEKIANTELNANKVL